MSRPVTVEPHPAPSPASGVSLRAILRFYIPLVLNSQMMTLSGPIINVAVGRSADPKLEFAGYWIGFTILLFIESACLATQSATASLARGFHSIRRIFIYALSVSLIASAMTLITAKTALGDLIFEHVIHTTPRVEELARTVLAWLCPVPVLIAMRGVANGIAIRARKTILVARATMIRLIAISCVVGFVVLFATGSGARAGVVASVVGIGLEAAVIWYGVWPIVRRYRLEQALDRERFGFGEIVRVALPLAVAAFAWTAFRPLVNGILGRLPDPELAQAGFGVVVPLVLLTSSPLWTLQNVVLMLPENRAELWRVRRFGLSTALLFSVAILLIMLSPLRSLILQRVFALSPELEAEVAPALLLIALEPIILSVRSMSQGLMMRARRTTAFAIFSPIKLAGIVIIGNAVVRGDPHVNGTLLGTLLLIGADTFEAIVYGIRSELLVRTGRVFESQAPRGAGRPARAE